MGQYKIFAMNAINSGFYLIPAQNVLNKYGQRHFTRNTRNLSNYVVIAFICTGYSILIHAVEITIQANAFSVSRQHLPLPTALDIEQWKMFKVPIRFPSYKLIMAKSFSLLTLEQKVNSLYLPMYLSA